MERYIVRSYTEELMKSKAALKYFIYEVLHYGYSASLPTNGPLDAMDDYEVKQVYDDYRGSK
jgi:hypothetical protein